MNQKNDILADGRWSGMHGIGRFSNEILSRLQKADIFTHGPAPLSLRSLVWQPYQLRRLKNHYRVYFTPGFNPVIYPSIPVVMTIHDLIHLHTPSRFKSAKIIYYQTLIKKAALHSYKIITVSEYSKNSIIEWANIADDNVIVATNGINQNFRPEGVAHQPGYPYLLNVGNNKSHKNIARLLQAFAIAKIDSRLRLILTSETTDELRSIIYKNKIIDRVIFCGKLTENQLIEYYRGAIGMVYPSLYEGFGLPVIEAMACGTPTLTSNVTSLPEIAGDAALLVSPYETEAIAHGIEQIVHDDEIRKRIIEKGLQRVKLFSWDRSADLIQKVLTFA